MPLRPTLALLVALAVGQAVGAPAARAADGFLDRLFGGSGAAPANPFASNYASGPPASEAVRERRERRPAPARPAREPGPVPPAAIPE